jgi:copper(I)-binding protein
MRVSSLAAAALAATLAAPIALPATAAFAAPAMMAMKAQPKSWTVGDLVISGAYARATLPHAPVGGGFITITNKGAADDTLVAASSPLAGSVQLHEMQMKGSVMEMRALPNGIPIPAGKTVTFSPNGLHLMFMQLTGAFVKGKTVPVTLTFAKAGKIGIELAVGGIAASAPPDAAPGAPAMSGGGMMGGSGGMKM